MYFERKELIQSLDLLCYVLFVYTWLLDNRTLSLLFRAILQWQCHNSMHIQPTWTLPFLVVFLTGINGIFALAHLRSPPRVTNTGEAILIDFVGHSYLPGRLHVLAIDVGIWFAQLLLTVVAFETSKDEARPDDAVSALDDLTSTLEEEDLGQGWDVRDEEATLFGLDEEDVRKRERTSLTHHIAVIRLRPIYDQIRAGQLLDSNAVEEYPVVEPGPAPVAPAPAPVLPDPSRPDTRRIRSFSRRSRPAAFSTLPPVTDEDEPYRGLGPVSADDSWPPMWIILARNMVGPSVPSFRPAQGLASLRDSITGRFGRALSHTPDRSQYTRVDPDAPPDSS